MGRKCFVANCSSDSYTSENISIFKAPSNVEELEKWIQHVPIKKRKLCASDNVCELHFAPEWITQNGPNGRKRLVKGAVPFVSPEAVKLEVKFSTGPEEHIIVKQPRELTEMKTSNSSNANLLIEDTVEDTHVEFTFKNVFSNPGLVTMPSDHWTVNVCSDMDFIIWSRILTENIDDRLNPHVLHITLSKSLDYKISLDGKELLHKRQPKSPETLSELNNVLLYADKLKFCAGGPRLSFYNHDNVSCADKCRGKWKHNQCHILSDIGKICKKCVTLFDILAKHKARRKRNAPVRIRVAPHLKSTTIMKKAMQKQSKTIARLQKRVKDLRTQLHDMQKKLQHVSEASVMEKIKMLNLPENQVSLIQECIKIGKASSKKGRRYSNQWLLLSLLLHIKSSAQYNMLRNNDILPLPCISTIKRYLRMVDLTTGFDDTFLKLFKKKMSSLSDFDKQGVLIMDEMAVRESVLVNAKNMSFYGLQDVNEQPQSIHDQADHALVFMFSSLYHKFEQPIGVFASKGPCKGDTLARLTLAAIINVEKAGGFVNGLICDGASTNRKMWDEFGVTGKFGEVRHFFPNPVDDSRKIYVFSDAPHLIKTIRNRLFNKKILKINGQFVKWAHYETVYDMDMKNAGFLKVCPKITKNHIYPTNFLKMRIKLATQIFSNSVARGMDYYRPKNQQLSNCDGTIKFTDRLNSMFDALNRRFAREGIKKGGKDIQILQDSLTWLDNWEQEKIDGKITIDEFLTKETAVGLRVTLHSTIALISYLLDKCGFAYVLTAKMNQDCLEKFFGTIRQSACQNDHPTIPTFLQLYKMLSIYKLIKPPKFGNCSILASEDTTQLCLQDIKEAFVNNQASYRSAHVKKLKEKLDGLIQTDKWECEDIIDHDYASAPVVDCIVYYVTGFITRKFKQRLTCEMCLKALSVKTPNCIIDIPEAQLVNIKTRGYLIHSNIFLFNLLRQAESYFSKYCDEADVYDKTIDDILNNVPLSFPCEDHKFDVIGWCLHYYVSMRMRQYVKQINDKHFKKSREAKKKAKLYKN